MRLVPSLLVITLASGCALRHPADSDSKPKSLVAVRLMYEDHEEEIVCNKSWAVWTEWAEPGRVFRLYDCQQGRVATTGNFREFLGWLEALPKGAEIERFDTCGARCSWGMSDESGELLSAVVKARDLHWGISPLSGEPRELVCTCETIRVEFPKP